MIAVEKQNIEDVTRILYDGADPNLLNPSGGSVLDISSRSSSENPAITKLLIAHGADVNTTYRFKETPLMVAARRGHEENCKVIINHGANCNAQDAKGDTALHFAALVGHESICCLLLKHGSNPKIKNRFFDTTDETAKSSPVIKDEAQRDRIVQLLLQPITG